jgi:hypothetical protein
MHLNYLLITAELTLDKTSLLNSVINCWNSLPADLVNVNTSNAFKAGLYKFDLTSFLIDI